MPVPVFKMSWFDIQVPLRYQSLIVLGILLANILPIAAFYTFVPGDRNTK